MTNTSRRPSTTFSGIFKLRSLKTRVTIFTLAFFLVGIWSLAFYASQMLREDMQRTLSEQQFSTVSIVAAEINAGLDDRIRALEQVAALITPAILGNAATTQTFIEGRTVLKMMFNGGIFVLLHDGTAIADFPLSTGRRGLNFMDRKYAIGALKEGKTTIGSPVMGKALRSTLFSIATPIHDTKGKVIGTLTGTVDLAKPNFLSRITDNSYGKTGGYLLVAPETRTIVYATDKKRIMEVLPGPGFNPLIDRAMKGWEGSGITIRPSNEVEILSSVKGVPVSGWYAAAIMPTAEAFAPIRAMQKRMLLATIFLTLLAGGLTWWMLKRQLEPVFTTIKSLAALSNTDQPMQPLPITRQDEIGELIGGFNHLLEALEKRGEALRESEEWHRTIMQTAMDGFWLVDTQGRLLEVSETYCRMSGYSKDELLTMSFSDLEAAETDTETASHMQRVMTLGEDRFETWHHRKDGSVYEVEISVQYKPSKEGQLVAFLRDITDRKQAEKGLHQSEEKFSKVFQTSPYAITITHPEDGKFIEVNDAFTTMTGFTREEALADSSIGLKLWVNEDDRQRVVADLRAGRAVVGQEINFRTKSDEIITGLFSAQAIQLNNGPCILSSINDISERKRAGEEKAKLEGQLQQAQKMESVGRLAGGVAHDFNNLLGVILGHAEMALDQVDQAEPVHADLEEIRKAANRSADLTRQLLAFARQQVVSPKVLDLNDTVEGMLKLLRRLIGEDINLSWQPGASLWPIKIDPSQIDQILANICVNARDAISDVGKMTIETENITFDEDYCIDHAGFVTGEYVLLTLSDDGCGMDKEILGKLFEPFFTTKGVGKGTGLGLATVYGIVKQNKGFINVYSEPDQGTTFRIYLPRHVGKATQMQREAPAKPVARGHETILLVEDEKTLLDLSKYMLEKQGCRVLTAGTPGEAIRLAEEKEGEIQLLMTDVVMPEMNGRDLAKKMLSLYPNLKCLFTSGYTANVIAHHGVLDEDIYFIQKPFSRRDLAAKIREVLDQE